MLKGDADSAALSLETFKKKRVDTVKLVTL